MHPERKNLDAIDPGKMHQHQSFDSPQYGGQHRFRFLTFLATHAIRVASPNGNPTKIGLVRGVRSGADVSICIFGVDAAKRYETFYSRFGVVVALRACFD